MKNHHPHFLLVSWSSGHLCKAMDCTEWKIPLVVPNVCLVITLIDHLDLVANIMMLNLER